MFFAFAVYPIGYALWMASKPSLYADLIADPLYLPTVVNTLLFVGLGVNVKMFLALLLSGFFIRPGEIRPVQVAMPGRSPRAFDRYGRPGCENLLRAAHGRLLSSAPDETQIAEAP